MQQQKLSRVAARPQAIAWELRSKQGSKASTACTHPPEMKLARLSADRLRWWRPDLKLSSSSLPAPAPAPGPPAATPPVAAPLPRPSRACRRPAACCSSGATTPSSSVARHSRAVAMVARPASHSSSRASCSSSRPAAVGRRTACAGHSTRNAAGSSSSASAASSAASGPGSACASLRAAAAAAPVHEGPLLMQHARVHMHINACTITRAHVHASMLARTHPLSTWGGPCAASAWKHDASPGSPAHTTDALALPDSSSSLHSSQRSSSRAGCTPCACACGSPGCSPCACACLRLPSRVLGHSQMAAKVSSSSSMSLRRHSSSGSSRNHRVRGRAATTGSGCHGLPRAACLPAAATRVCGCRTAQVLLRCAAARLMLLTQGVAGMPGPR